MRDLISRQAAIDAVCEHGTDLERRGITVLSIVNHKQATVDLLEPLPSVQEREEKRDEWCTDCKEYDNDRHCCPRWNRIIRNTVEELKAEHRWIPVTERLPDDDTLVLVNYIDRRPDAGDIWIGWHEMENVWYIDGEEHSHERGNEVIAWMPLPEPYEGENQ